MNSRPPSPSRRLCAAAALLLGLPALLWCAGGCGKHETPVEIGDRTGVLHLGNGAEPRELDPATASSVTDSNIIQTLFEGLVRLAPDGHTILPGAAERWEISTDGRTYTFHLRPGLRWSNGDALTSADFLYSFRRVVEPPLGSEMAIYADWVAGGKDYREGRTHELVTIGFAAPDPRTFTVTLRVRAPFWLDILTQNPFYPVHRATIEKYDAYLRREGNWTRPGVLVGNGPFVLKAWRTNSAIVVEKNPRYWDAAHVRLRQVVFHPIDNADAEEKAFRGGLLHATRSLPASKLDSYRRSLSPLLHVDPLVQTSYVEINIARLPFNDVRVRQAFALALDREALVRDVKRDGSRVADSLCVPGSGPSPGYAPRAGLAYDPARARALLAEAGFPRGVGFPRVTLNFTSVEDDPKLVEAMQAMWQKTLSVHVDLASEEEKVRLDNQRTKNFQLSLARWLDINDPAMLLQLFLSQSPTNDSNWASVDYDREFAAAGQSLTNADRWPHLQNADAMLVEAVPLIPLYHLNQNYLVQPEVRGWEDNLLNSHLPSDLWLQARGAR